MTTALNPDFRSVQAPPVMEVRRWVEDLNVSPDRQLLNVSQAAPVEPPPDSLRDALAEAIREDASCHTYGPVLGDPDLREEMAERWSRSYGGAIESSQVAVTSGCNQAFCAAALSLCRTGDALLVPVPWYFNHGMWLGMNGIEARPLPLDNDLLPDPDRAESLLDARVKGILLVSPNNPSGVEYPSGLLHAFLDLARAKGIALIMDETYRDFASVSGAPHRLFGDPEWDDTFIHLYSFSKAYRLTGHRVGALVASRSRLDQVEKFLDSVSICPNRLAQRGALFGLRHLSDWLADERREILARRDAMTEGFSGLAGWTLKGCGAYFAYAEHPSAASSNDVALRLLDQQGILAIPGSMFAPPSGGAVARAADRHIRFAFANIDISGIGELFARLRDFQP